MSGTDTLPPKPDPTTGEPRPPHGPIYGKPATSDGHDPKAGKPKPPSGFGPTLEWHVQSNKSALLTAGVTLAFILGVLVLLRGVTWMQYWWAWAGSVGIAALIWWMGKDRHYEAGADWLRHRGWVNTYRLHEIQLNVLEGSVSLTLQDDLGGALSIDVQELQSHQRMWDLVYNGMRHSVANGVTVTINNYARTAFKLPTANPTAPSRARYDELKATRRKRRTRHLPSLLLHIVGWLLLALSLVVGLAASGPDRADGIRGAIVFGVVALALIGGAFWLAPRRHRRSSTLPE
jgi:hypothetical protein